MDKRVKVVALSSGKGGVGKSIFCANMANILSYYNYKLLVIDMALGLANQDIIFNQKPNKNLLHFLKGESSLEEIEIKIKENLTLIPSQSGDEILSYSPQIFMHKILKSKKDIASYDYIFLDLPSDISISTQSILELADEVIIIAEANPSSISDAYTTLKICDKLDKSTSILLNRVKSSHEANLIYSKIKGVAQDNLEIAENLEFLGSIQKSRYIEKSSKNRYLFTEIFPNSTPSYELNEIIKKLVYKLEQKMLEKKRRKSLVNFLRRLIE